MDTLQKNFLSSCLAIYPPKNDSVITSTNVLEPKQHSLQHDYRFKKSQSAVRHRKVILCKHDNLNSWSLCIPVVKLIGNDKAQRSLPNIAPRLIPRSQIDRIRVLRAFFFYFHIHNRVMSLKLTPIFLYPTVLYE